MQQRTIINKGKRYLVNVVADDEGVGAGFPLGIMTFKSYTDSYWYFVEASGSAGNVQVYVSQSQIQWFGTSSYYDINYPYQLMGSTDGNVYQLFLTGSAPAAGIIVSQSAAYSGSYITNSYGAIIDTAKPNLLLYNVSDGNYYIAFLSSSGGTTTLQVSQTMISASWLQGNYN